nr:hypothetical protein F511_41137 [Ipomoea batatas]
MTRIASQFPEQRFRCSSSQETPGLSWSSSQLHWLSMHAEKVPDGYFVPPTFYVRMLFFLFENPQQVFEHHHFASDGDGLVGAATGALRQFLEHRVVDDVEANHVLATRLAHVHRVEVLRRGGVVRAGVVLVVVVGGVGGDNNNGAGVMNL